MIDDFDIGDNYDGNNGRAPKGVIRTIATSIAARQCHGGDIRLPYVRTHDVMV